MLKTLYNSMLFFFDVALFPVDIQEVIYNTPGKQRASGWLRNFAFYIKRIKSN